jgi:FXSXX-COOH protein
VGDDLINGGSVDEIGLSLTQVQALGDSVLGHALRRVIEGHADGAPSSSREPIAAFNDCI